MNAGLPADLRLVLAHKQNTSARLRFLRFPHGLCAFDPLPPLSVVAPDDTADTVLHYHPNAWLRVAESHLGLDSGALQPEAEFKATVQTPDGPIAVQLATLNTVDPPFALAEALGARFVAITETRDCMAAELELLRRAYAALLG